MKTITFYFDFISPYAYLAWTQIHVLAARHECEVEPKPILFAALLDANGQKGPAEIPNKRVYTFKDTVRSAARLGVPLAAPASHPFNPLLALRVASAEVDAQRSRSLVDALFAATWVRSVDVTDAKNVEEVVQKAGLDGQRLKCLTIIDEWKAFGDIAPERAAFGEGCRRPCGQKPAAPCHRSSLPARRRRS